MKSKRPRSDRMASKTSRANRRSVLHRSTINAQRRPRTGEVRQSAQMESCASTARNRLQPTQRPTRVTSATVSVLAGVDDELRQRGSPVVVHAGRTRDDERRRSRPARRRLRLREGDELHALGGDDILGHAHGANDPTPESDPLPE